MEKSRVCGGAARKQDFFSRACCYLRVDIMPLFLTITIFTGRSHPPYQIFFPHSPTQSTITNTIKQHSTIKLDLYSSQHLLQTITHSSRHHRPPKLKAQSRTNIDLAATEYSLQLGSTRAFLTPPLSIKQLLWGIPSRPTTQGFRITFTALADFYPIR